MVEQIVATIVWVGMCCWCAFGLYYIYRLIKFTNLKKSYMKRKHKGCFNCNNCIDAYDGDFKYSKCKIAGKDYSLVEGVCTDYEYCKNIVGKFNCWWAAKESNEQVDQY